MIYLDTDVGENTKEDREITAFLYGGDDCYRLKARKLSWVSAGYVCSMRWAFISRSII